MIGIVSKIEDFWIYKGMLNEGELKEEEKVFIIINDRML